MAISPEYRDYVLGPLGRVQARPMFGGAGLFRDGLMFGLITRRDILYFKTDDQNRGEYEAAGMGPFMPYENRPTVMSYHEVPAHLLEDAEEIAEWAGRAFAAALRARDRKPSRRKKKTKGRGPVTRNEGRARGDVRMFVSGGLRGGYSERVDEIHEKEHPQCRKLRRSRVYRARSG